MVRRNPVIQQARQYRRLPIQEQRGSRKSRSRSIPAPVGGWNAKDSLSMMRETDAVTMKNWFPRQSDVITRPGFSSHCDTTEDTYNVKQLIPFENAAAAKLVAAVNGKLIDVTTATPSSLATGLSDNDWSFAYLSNVVLLANGADVVKSYDGTSIASPSFTGVTLTSLIHVHVHGSRAYFVENNSQSMWYGGTGAISGALTEFDFSAVESIKGDLMFTASLKGDGGEGGANDIFIAVFKGGDVMAYSGTNPSDPTNWNKVGHYKIGRPLGRLGYAAADDDCYVITDRGFEKISELIKFGDSAPERLLLSAKIQEAVIEDTSSLGVSDDWRVNVYPSGQMLMFTSPRAGDARRYFVRNINTGAWCEFNGFLAYSWAVMQGNCYFGGQDGIIYEFDDGSTSDNGTQIRSDCQQAWTSLGAPGHEKTIKLVRPFVKSQAKPSISVNVASDFDPITLASFSIAGTPTSSLWDVAVWDVDVWGDEDKTWKTWFGRNALGETIGLRIALDSSAQRVSWNKTIIMMEVGGLV